MWLAIDTATDQASVALGLPGELFAEASLLGARRHAGALLPLLERVLREAHTTLGGLEAVIVADGPGSFTGLRVGATVAKALVRARRVGLWSAPSLLSCAAAASNEGDLVLAVNDALRGECFAAAYRIFSGRIETVLSPTVLAPDLLRSRVPRPDRITGPGAALLGGIQTLPRASTLLGLVGRVGGARRIADPAGWEPEYGRPAEAQVQWELAHGRPIRDPAGTAR